MKKEHIFLLMFGIISSFYSCKKETKIDTPAIVSYQTSDVAYMGDSIPLSTTVTGEYPLSSIKVTFFQGNEKISESLIPVKESGSYMNKILIPFVKDAEDGNAEIQIMVKNRNFNYSIANVPIQVTRPLFPYLTLKTAYGDYRMEPVPGEQYKYAVTEVFPATDLSALIEAPAYGDNGNAFYFGGKTITANVTNQDSIPFQTDLPLGTAYTVSFDTRTFKAEPFLIPSFAGTDFPDYSGNTAVIEQELVQGQSVSIRGILDISEWWIDPTFLDKGTDGSLSFRAADGKYRITANRDLRYFSIEPMDGDHLADFDPATLTGGVWVNGGIGNLAGSAPPERLGIPSLTSNPTLWNPGKNIAMAPMGGGIYQIKLIANQTLFLSNVSGSNAGIGFYKNSRSLDNAFALDLIQSLYGSPGSPSADAGTPRFELNPGNSNSNGQMIVSGSNRSLGNGRTYVFTLDTNVSPASVSISLE